MKTVKEISTQRIERVKDAEAYIKVETSRWIFCPKSEWKTKVRNPIIEEIGGTEELPKEKVKDKKKKK